MTQLIKKHLFTIPSQCELGEGILWDAENQQIIWTDIEDAKLCFYPVQSAKLSTIDLPERLCSFALTNKTNELLCAFETGLARFNYDTKTLHWLQKLEQDNLGSRMNDGRMDRFGNFWFGSMIEDQANASELGHLYCYTASGELTKRMSNIHISNGLCWAPDGKTMYHADSPSHEIYQYDTAECSVTNKQLFAKVDNDHHPDGATVDAVGNVWSALWGSHQVVCFSNTGQRQFELTLPVSQPSCVAIGGPDNDWLIISSARQLTEQQKQQEPQAGNVFVYQLNEPLAIPEARFSFD